jgi:hypothetical protein
MNNILSSLIKVFVFFFSNLFISGQNDHILVCFFFCSRYLHISRSHKKKKRRINIIIYFIPFFLLLSHLLSRSRGRVKTSGFWYYSHLPPIQLQYNESSFSYYSCRQALKPKTSDKPWTAINMTKVTTLWFLVAVVLINKSIGEYFFFSERHLNETYFIYVFRTLQRKTVNKLDVIVDFVVPIGDSK